MLLLKLKQEMWCHMETLRSHVVVVCFKFGIGGLTASHVVFNDGEPKPPSARDGPRFHAGHR